MRVVQFLYLFIISNLFTISFAQINMSVFTIPEKLIDNAYSVVRKNEIVFTCQSLKEGGYKEEIIITVLSPKGRDAGYFHFYGDTFRELKQFSGELYNGDGVLLRKIKRSDVKFTEYSSDLASDDKYYYYECVSPVYPYTIKYEYEVKYKQGIISFPKFIPQKYYNQSIENASYKLILPANVDLKYKALGMEETPKKQSQKNSTVWEWSISDVSPIENELFSPPLLTLVPCLLASPIHFIYANNPGDMTDWKSFGLWQYGLLQNRDALPEQLKQEVRTMTENIKDEKGKVRVLYDYLAKTTRYVSIQLGIGGLQPIAASEVAQNHFGDCKGLTNYMKAMLQEVGILSYYTVISTDNARLIPDFSSAQQMNHVILQVPLPEDTLWLECTNAQLPFGYVHNNIAGHDALLIKETGGEVKQLPSYPDSMNVENYYVKIKIDDSGKAIAQVERKSYLSQYENLLGYVNKGGQEQIDFLRKGLRLSQATLSNCSWKENKSAFPFMEISYDLISEQFGNKTGNRLFIPMNIFRNGFSNPKTKKRIYDICPTYGYQDCDTIIIQIPDNYQVESAPKPLLLDTKFGKFASSLQVNGNEIMISQRFYFRAGNYKAAEYEAFLSFCMDVTAAYNGKIVLCKKRS